MLAATVRHDRHVAGENRRRHLHPVAALVRVEAFTCPKQFAVGGIVNGQALGTPDNNGLTALILDDVRRGVAVIALDRGFIVAGLLPRQLAGALIECSQVRLAGVHHRQHHVLDRQNR